MGKETVQTIFFPPSPESPSSRRHSGKEHRDEKPHRLERQKQTEFRNFTVGDQIAWADQETSDKFTKPAFGYGNGSFTLLSIRNVGGHVLFEIQTPEKGRHLLSADYFRKLE
jgi:hypothetical protein